MKQGEVRDRIEDLIREYVHCIDDGRLGEWPGFFTEDCRYQIIPRRSYERGEPVGVFYCDSRSMLEDRILCLNETSIFESHSYRHMVSATRLLGGGGGVYKAETNFHVARTWQNGDSGMFCTGKYVDTVVIENGQARFREKLVLTDSARYDVLLVIPI